MSVSFSCLKRVFKSQGMGEFISQELANSVGNSVNLDARELDSNGKLVEQFGRREGSEVWAFAKLHFRHEALLTAASFLALWLPVEPANCICSHFGTKKSYGKLYFLTFWGLCRRHSADVCASQRFIESWLYRVIDAPVALCMFSYVTDMLGRPQLNQTILQNMCDVFTCEDGTSVSHSTCLQWETTDEDGGRQGEVDQIEGKQARWPSPRTTLMQCVWQVSPGHSPHLVRGPILNSWM